MALEPRRQLLVSRGWVQAVAIVMIFGFTVMGMLAYRTYTGEPPIPARVTDDSGHVLFTRGDILAGQAVFLRNGLMEYGSIFGHGAYLVLLCYKKPRRQQGHLGRERARWVAIWRRRVAIEDGLCRSVRTGSAAGRVAGLHTG
jgi:hypothetical protein